jgi:hypothetical protein
MHQEQFREKDLQDNIQQNYQLQKKLEDELRFVTDAKDYARIENEIEKLKTKTIEYKQELHEISHKQKEEARNLLSQEISDVTFYELDIVTKSIIGMQPIYDNSRNTDLTPIIEKISKNNLTDDVRFSLTLGMSKVQEVTHFIDISLNFNPSFSDKLTTGFVRQYKILIDRGIKGDELFNQMHQFSCSNNTNQAIKLAALAVLCYLFERCEVFEK